MWTHPKSYMSESKEKLFSKKEVIAIIDDMLQRVDMVDDALHNENSDYDAESFFNVAVADALPKLTMQDFFDGLRKIVDKANSWWHRDTSQEENKRLLEKHYPNEPYVSDEMIVNMYLKENKMNTEL